VFETSETTYRRRFLVDFLVDFRVVLRRVALRAVVFFRPAALRVVLRRAVVFLRFAVVLRFAVDLRLAVLRFAVAFFRPVLLRRVVFFFVAPVSGLGAIPPPIGVGGVGAGIGG
jgi:hypothetical protein